MAKIKRILIVAGYVPSLINFRGKLIEALAKLDWMVTVAAPDFDDFPEVIQFLENLNVSYKSIPLARNGLNPIVDLQTCIAIRRLVKESSPSIVLSYTIKPVIWCGIALYGIKKTKYYALVTGLGFAFDSNSLKRKLLGKLVSFLYRISLFRSSLTIFQNEDDLLVFTSNKILPFEKGRIVNGSGVDLEKFEVADLPPQPYKFLLIARLLKDKGILEYVAAARILKKKYPEVQFHLVGWIDTNPAAIQQSQLDEWISEGVVNFHGRLSDVRGAIKNCHVYVLPSYREGTPRTVLEAMATGRAVITTSAPGCKETVIDGYNGFLVPVGDSVKLAEKMITFIENPIMINTMGVASRKFAEQKYCVNKVNSQMLQYMGVNDEAGF